MNYNFKFIQINIYKGKYLAELVKFLRNENPDFIALQEVSSGSVNLCENKKIDLFSVLTQSLKYYGVRENDIYVKKPPGSFGNAIFSKYRIKAKYILRFKDSTYRTIEELYDESLYEHNPRHLLSARIDFKDRDFHVISWHGTWTAPPTDTKETLRQSSIAADYIKKIKGQYVIGCDLNSTLAHETVKKINRVANNLLLGENIHESTNPKVHKIAPLGFLVDFIYTSSKIRKKSIKVPQITVSDHLPVIANLEFKV